jgi:hypothetical protein
MNSYDIGMEIDMEENELESYDMLENTGYSDMFDDGMGDILDEVVKGDTLIQYGGL